jgi:putative transposase
MMQAVENLFGINAAPSKPIEWLRDNGSRYTKLCKVLGLKPITTPLTSPQSNDMA